MFESIVRTARPSIIHVLHKTEPNLSFQINEKETVFFHNVNQKLIKLDTLCYSQTPEGKLFNNII